MLGQPRSALANEPNVPHALAHRSVEVRVAGPPEEARALQDSLAELMRRLDLELHVTSVDSLPEPAWSSLPPDTAVDVRVDLRQPDAALVTLSSPHGGGPTDPRRVPWRDSRELLVEETALVVYAGTESLLDEGPAEPPAPLPKATPAALAVTVSKPAPADARTEPPRVAGQPAPWVIQAAMFAGAQTFASDDLAVPGFGVGARTHVGRAWLPGWWLLGAVHFPSKKTRPPVELTTNVWSLRLVPTFQLGHGSAWSFELGAGGGVDIFSMAVALVPGAAAPAAKLADNLRGTSALVSAMGAASFGSARSSLLVLAATLDGDLTPRRYVVVSPANRSTLLQWLPLRPALTLGFSFDAAGSRGEE